MSPRLVEMNAARCPSCGDIVVSLHLHDYCTCKCGDIAVDGGKGYARRAFKKDRLPIEGEAMLTWPVAPEVKEP